MLSLTTVAEAAVVIMGLTGSADIGHEDIAPVRRARTGVHVLHVEHEVTKVFVKDARLNLVEACEVASDCSISMMAWLARGAR